MIGVRTLIGGNGFATRPDRPVRAAADVHDGVSARLADLRRLEDDLDRARLRYERAIADYDRRRNALEGRASPAAAGDEKIRRLPSVGGTAARIRLSTATFDDLRALGLSVTQARRVLRHRSEGNVDSVAGLERVPGIPAGQLAELKRRLRD